MNLIGWTIEHQKKDVNEPGSLTLEEEREIEVKSALHHRAKQKSTGIPRKRKPHDL
jgi:hypothetical protein